RHPLVLDPSLSEIEPRHAGVEPENRRQQDGVATECVLEPVARGEWAPVVVEADRLLVLPLQYRGEIHALDDVCDNDRAKEAQDPPENCHQARFTRIEGLAGPRTTLRASDRSRCGQSGGGWIWATSRLGAPSR